MVLLKVVFLDVDGVLNYAGCREKFGHLLGVEDECVKRLQKIVFSQEPHAQIVLTSSWKTLWNNQPVSSNEIDPMAKYLVDKLHKFGMHIADRTEEKNPMQRGMGIQGWLRKVHDVEGWVVLDDEVFYDYEERGIIPHLVKTSFSIGITDSHVDEAIRILNGEPKVAKEK